MERPNSASITIAINNIEDTRSFYERVFEAKAVFDCGWYVVLRLGDKGNECELCLMEPRDGMSPYAGGSIFNLSYRNVDECYQIMISHKVEIVIPLKDHPWGDRGFGFVDPAGQMVYCLTPIQPDESFRQYYISD